MLSKRADKALETTDFLGSYLLQALGNAYHPIDNPKGIVNLGTVENKTCEDLWIKKIGELAPLIADKMSLYYCNFSGFEFLRRNIGKFLARKLDLPKPLDPQEIVLQDGVTGILNAAALAIGDEGDTILCVTPSFGRFRNDIEDVAGVRFYEVPMFEERDKGDAAEFHLNVIEKYYRKAIDEGHNVRGLILCNPQNPTGKVYSKQEVGTLLKFCARKKIHILVDEIFALSCHEKTKFTSVLQCDIPDPSRTHFMWGFSKDLSLSGFRCGMLYSKNARLINHLRKSSAYGTISAPTQVMLNAIISDTEWLDRVYLPTYRKRLQENLEFIRGWLKRHSIPFYCGSAGGFIWVNLTKFLPKKTYEEELALFERLLKGGLYICPGKEMFSPYPGWFRITFSVQKDRLAEGLKRIENKILSTWL